MLILMSGLTKDVNEYETQGDYNGIECRIISWFLRLNRNINEVMMKKQDN